MKTMRKGVKMLLAALAMSLVLVGGAAPQAQAAKWKKMTKSKQMDHSFYSKYKKTKKVRLTIKTSQGTKQYTFKKSKIQSEVKRLSKAMKKGLKKNPKAKFSYKSGKFKVTLTINKKKGSFVAKNGKKTIFSKNFTFSKWKKNTYLIKNSTKKVTMTLKLYNTSKKSYFRLFSGKTTSRKKELARFGVTKGKYVFAQSKIPYFMLTKAEYK